MKSAYPILAYFQYEHLPEKLKKVSQPFCEIAKQIAEMETKNPQEVASALRKLLEAKDCAVRAAL